MSYKQGTHAWLALAAGADRQHGSNDGYSDVPAESYVWDSTVPNHAALQVGHQIVLWDKSALIGLSVIDAIDTSTETKIHRSCPKCGKASLKARKTMQPLYKCFKCGATFDDAIVVEKEVVEYRSRHEAHWIDLQGLLSAADLRTLCTSPKSQLSLRPLDWERFSAELEHAAGAPILRVFSSEVADVVAEGHRKATVRVRIGQAGFRCGLLEDYGAVCAVTGPAPDCALEAAHLYSYANTGKHHQFGGLLLRRDIHRLFDFGLIAVDPATGLIDVHESLQEFSEYWGLHGEPVFVPLVSGHHRWLKQHWQQHRGA